MVRRGATISGKFLDLSGKTDHPVRSNDQADMAADGAQRLLSARNRSSVRRPMIRPIQPASARTGGGPFAKRPRKEQLYRKRLARFTTRRCPPRGTAPLRTNRRSVNAGRSRSIHPAARRRQARHRRPSKISIAGALSPSAISSCCNPIRRFE